MQPPTVAEPQNGVDLGAENHAPADAMPAKIKSLDELAAIIQSLKGCGKRVVHCHGVFDLVHPGHVRHFEAAKRQGDVLVVTVTKDEYVNKGPGRPVSTNQRALDSDRILARHVLSAAGSFDPTGGATNFINPRLQDELARTGRVPGYYGQTYARVRERWIRRYGWEPYYRLGPDLEFWGRKRKRG